MTSSEEWKTFPGQTGASFHSFPFFLICFYRTMKANRLEFAERAARLNSPDYL